MTREFLFYDPERPGKKYFKIRKNPGKNILWPGNDPDTALGRPAAPPDLPCLCEGAAAPSHSPRTGGPSVLAVSVITETARALAVSLFHRHSKDQIEVPSPWE